MSYTQEDDTWRCDWCGTVAPGDEGQNWAMIWSCGPGTSGGADYDLCAPCYKKFTELMTEKRQRPETGQ